MHLYAKGTFEIIILVKTDHRVKIWGKPFFKLSWLIILTVLVTLALLPYMTVMTI